VLIVGLRNFCRFLEFSGRIRIGLTGALPRVPTPPSTKPPKVLEIEQWQRFLRSFPRTALGKRDYAIALCLSRLALRSHEVTTLTLDDIDWRARTLRLNHTKQRRERLLSMPDELIKGLAIYLKQARPHTESRALFVHHNQYVGRPLSTQCIRNVVRIAFERCGIAASGTHILRHTWATHAHRRGASLKLIADILGHTSLQTTLRYAHVNLEELRQAALPWPRGRK
jgi:integrase